MRIPSFKAALRRLCERDRSGLGVNLGIGGRFEVECYRSDGSLRWKDTIKNAVTTAGLNNCIDRYLGATAKSTAWHVGLIRDDNYSALAAGDTMASHAGWEEGDEYDEWTAGRTGRATLTLAGASGGVDSNTASRAEFTISATQTMKGAFITDTLKASTGTLFCTGLFTGGDRAVEDGDTLRVTYTITATAA